MNAGYPDKKGGSMLTTLYRSASVAISIALGPMMLIVYNFNMYKSQTNLSAHAMLATLEISQD